MSIVFTANTVRPCKELRGTPDNLIEETLEVLKIVIPHVHVLYMNIIKRKILVIHKN